MSEIEKERSKTKRLIRGGLALAILCTVLVLIGSVYIRKTVTRKLESRAAESSSLLRFTPFQIKQGLSLKNSRLESRLKRLGYRPSEEIKKSGFYKLEADQLEIFLRPRLLDTGKNYESERIKLSLSEGDRVLKISGELGDNTEDRAWLEPEIISRLGDSSTRAVDFYEIEDFPPQLLAAVIAIEDERFYSHFGIDPKAIARAFLANLNSGRIVQGGSTITQQLAKNLIFTSERTFTRKALEAISAILLETAYSKQQILEFYMNEIFLAQEGNVAIHGFAEAARSFFAKPAGELSLAESATLAGLIKAPSSYSPRKHPKRAAARRKIVLDKMKQLELINESEFSSAVDESLSIQPARGKNRKAPFFTDFVRRVLPLESGLDKTLFINSGMDSEYQLCAESAVRTGLDKLEKTRPALTKGKGLQAALISLAPQSGVIRAWVGGRNYSTNQFDRVSQARRQPGSVFKPFVYLTALDKNLNDYRVARTTTLLDDTPVSIDIPGSEPWQPKNYDEKFRGEVTLRQALTFSLNIPTVELAQKVGVNYVANTASLFGLGENLPLVPSIALGAGEVSPLEVARAYAAIANGGEILSVSPVRSITSPLKNTPLANFDAQSQKVASPQATFVLTNIMQSVIEAGTGRVVRRLGYKGPVAGKTGTSNESRDAWFAGFSPHLLTVVWVGFDNNAKTGLTGASGAAPIWTEYHKCVKSLEPELDFIPPKGVLFRDIDQSTGLLMSPDCREEHRATEIFVEGTEPITSCNMHNSYHAPEDYRRQTGPGVGRERHPPRPKRKKRPNLLERIFG